MNDELRSFDERTGHQILVYIGRTTGGYPIEEFAVKSFEAWRPGRKGLDDGLILFIMADDRKIRIEVGYGLEDRVPDATASVVINDIMDPRVQSGDHDGAVRSAIAALSDAITKGEAPAKPAGSKPKSEIPTPLVIIVLAVFIIIFIKNPGFALWLLFNILGGGRGGGGGFGGGGGGFRGGGGRSGGGGASGGW